MPTLPAGNPGGTGAPPTTPRGDVTIDPRRQQLIGVKTVPVVRQTVDQIVAKSGKVANRDRLVIAIDLNAILQPVEEVFDRGERPREGCRHRLRHA